MKQKIAALIIASILWVAGMTLYLSPTDTLQKVDAIVAVSGGNTKARVLSAVELYQNGWAPIIIFSGAALDPDSPSNAEVMRTIALEAGVPEKSIRIEEEAENTVQNARKTNDLVEAFEYDSIILVTSPYHQQRTYLEFNDRFDNDVKIINAPAEDSEWSRLTWFLSGRGWQLTMLESIKTPLTHIQTLF